MSDELGEPTTLFSYPVGGRDTFDERTRACVRAAGITHAFSFYGGYRRRGDLDRLDIPRTYVSPTLSSARFRAGVTLPRIFCRPARGPARPDPSAHPAAWGGMVRRGIVWDPDPRC